MNYPTQARVKQLYEYVDGTLVRKISSGAGATFRPVGSVAGTMEKTRKHWAIDVDGVRCRLSSVIWLWHYGEYVKWLDHKDRNPSNNKIENLRISDVGFNNCNKSKIKQIEGRPTSSQYKGVWWNKYHNKWTAQVMYKKVNYFIGLFTDEKEAAIAYNRKALEVMPQEFVVLNVVS